MIPIFYRYFLMSDRRSIRLAGYDYGCGVFFVTICTAQKQCVFGYIDDGIMRLNKLGHIVQTQWEMIPQRYSNVIIDDYIVMPNHMHGIVHVGAPLAGAQFTYSTKHAKSLGDVVGSFKSLCVTEWLQYIQQHHLVRRGLIWQRNYYERIVRDENELNNVRRYIRNNPGRWGK